MPHVAADVQKHARAAPGLHPALGEGYRGRAPPRRSPFARSRRSSEYGLAITPSFQKTRAPDSLIHRPLGIPDSTSTGCALAVNFQEVVHSALIVNAEVAKHQRFAENRMDTHKNAPLTPKGPEAIVGRVTENGLNKAT